MNNPVSQRRILLVEPGYRNKYPPLGLMKLATYHRNRGDFVRFFKGDLRKLVVDLYADEIVEKFYAVDESINWRRHKVVISRYIQCGSKIALTEITGLSSVFSPSIENWLKYYNKAYRSGKIVSSVAWDRICITSLFTFYYKKTIETIQYCKKLLADNGEILVGGVMASLIPNEVEDATGIKPVVGLLDKPAVLDANNSIIIDQLPPDYSILEEVDYNYPERDGYYGYTSRGCIRKCDFCAVPTLEPIFKEYLPITEQLEQTDKLFGARRNLLLLDNNVLASKRFPEIIKEIRDNGFTVGARFSSPNYLEIAVRNIENKFNEFAYRRQVHSILLDFTSRLRGTTLEDYLETLKRNDITEDYLPTSAQIISAYVDVKYLYDKRRNKAKKNRYVDFNQGVDARLLNDKKMSLLATIPIRPLRIAFDSMKFAKAYENAVRLAAKYEIINLSNYLLFNFEDEPVELYQRMRLNVELSNELALQIYSFPMRFSPIIDDNNLHHGRDYIGKLWNKKFIRAVQTVLNATKGKVGTKLDFFKAAFGENEDEFFEIMYMPEAYILYRRHCEDKGFTGAWRELFRSLSDEELKVILPTIESNDFSQISSVKTSPRALTFLEHYQSTYKEIKENAGSYEKLKERTLKFVTPSSQYIVAA